ncbi:hypothetical protein O3M35_008184 [Rhynocoris fuscipes]|uniref:V-type proton ATPase subunit H n=1 Tax=Rhynocoris fuscipes TaxID=488301 RepID=A0AAW1D5C4_9HEMI
MDQGPEDPTAIIGKTYELVTATSLLYKQAAEIRKLTINWDAYLRSQMIAREAISVILAIDNASQQEKEYLIQENRSVVGAVYVHLLSRISKVETLQYILVMIDDMLQEDHSTADIFREESLINEDDEEGIFLSLLSSADDFVKHMDARIIAKIACWSSELMDRSDLHYYLSWLCERLKRNNDDYFQSVVRCLQIMLRVDEYRAAFVSVDGLPTLSAALTSKHNTYQSQYQLIFCVWVLSFNPKLAESMNRFIIIPILAEILSDCVKEKVIRIILASFRNFIEKPEDEVAAKENCISMVQSKVLKQLNILDQRKFDDEDMVDDIHFLTAKLQASVQDLSSFDEYASEVRSGLLEWSPVHRSEQFWRENCSRLNEKNYELLRILIHLLETKREPLILSVACFDIGEYVRHYPRGKIVIENLGGKDLVMSLLGHEDPNVRYEALIAVQKLMVHNWEYLGRQLESPAGKTQAN